jgi:SsrA-binding protein
MKQLKIVNKKAKFEYQFIQSLEAGISLVGTEVKSVKAGNVSMSDAYCLFKNGELYVKSLYIAEYEMGNINNHETRRDRKLLLKKSELKKLERRVFEKGYLIVPYKLYMSDRGFIKLEIVLAQGKKSYDKRHAIKDRESKRDLDRIKKLNN